MDRFSTVRMMNDIINALPMRTPVAFEQRRDHLLRQQLVLLTVLAKSEQLSQIADEYARLADLARLHSRP